MDSKRISFPRFYFLSDEDLLDILARSKELDAFQRHLSKCFEAIDKVRIIKLENQNLVISAMISPEGEFVRF